jgi:hypothetical protein
MKTRFLPLLFAALALAACALHPPGDDSDSRWTLTKIYFGRSYPGGVVSDADFNAFLDTCVSRRFPEGLTRYDAEGRWRDSAGVAVREPSVVVEILNSGEDSDRILIKQIVASYKSRFAQKSVLVVEDHPRVQF